MDTPSPEGNTTPSSQEAGRESPHRSLISKPIPSHLQRAANTTSVIAPSFHSVFTSPAKSLPSGRTPALTFPGNTLQDSLILPISASTFNDAKPAVLSPPSDSFISEYFRTKVSNGQHQNNLVRATQGWVGDGKPLYLTDTTVLNICIAHCVETRELSNGLALSSGKGRRSAAFKAIADELGLKTEVVKSCHKKGFRYLLLARSGLGSLLLLGRGVRTLWERDLLREDIPLLLEFRMRYMPDFDVRAREFNERATEIFVLHFATQGWKSISLIDSVTNGLLKEGKTSPPTPVPISLVEPAAKFSPDDQKKRSSDPVEGRPPKRSAHVPAEESGLKWLLEAAIQKEYQNVVEDPFPQPVGGPDITMFMETFHQDGQSNPWMQYLLPSPEKGPDTTISIETLDQTTHPSPVETPYITMFMDIFDLEQQSMWMEDRWHHSVVEPGMTLPMKPSEQDACLPLSQPVQAMQQVQTMDEGEVLQTIKYTNNTWAQQ